MTNQSQLNLTKKCTDLKKSLLNLDIINQETFDLSTEYLKTIKDLSTTVNNLFDPSLKKAKEAVKELEATKKQFSVPLKNLETTLKEKQRKYFFEQEQKIKVEIEKNKKETQEIVEEFILNTVIKREEEGKNVDTLLEVPVKEFQNLIPSVEKSSNIFLPKVDKRSFQKRYKIKIIDITLIPAKYMVPNEKLILVAVKETKGNIKIPGIEIYYE